jgi:hypothetical protein
MATRNYSLLVIFHLLLLLMARSPAIAIAIAIAKPFPSKLIETAHKPGTCPTDYTWTVITPISTLGATCCPRGYRGEEAKILGDLAGVFCCPEDDLRVPCEEGRREMPRTPETCPSPGKLVGALCMEYYW